MYLHFKLFFLFLFDNIHSFKLMQDLYFVSHKSIPNSSSQVPKFRLRTVP